MTEEPTPYTPKHAAKLHAEAEASKQEIADLCNELIDALESHEWHPSTESLLEEAESRGFAEGVEYGARQREAELLAQRDAALQEAARVRATLQACAADQFGSSADELEKLAENYRRVVSELEKHREENGELIRQLNQFHRKANGGT